MIFIIFVLNKKIMESYNSLRYYFPPRPEYIIRPDQLINYEKDHLAQPKLNGTCCEIYIKGKDFKYFGRHRNENFANFRLKTNDLEVLNCGNNNWNVIVGEYLNKNQSGIDGKPWNHKFVIFDILVYNGQYLIDTSFQERVELLDKLFGIIDENEYLYKINDNIYRVKSFYDNFLERWNEIIKIGVFEGFVLKKKEQKLFKGLSEKNNMSHKCRKPTKNYRH